MISRLYVSGRSGITSARVETLVCCPTCRTAITIDLDGVPPCTPSEHYEQCRRLAAAHDERCATAYAEGLR